jgi:hypothetical protein
MVSLDEVSARLVGITSEDKLCFMEDRLANLLP